MCGICGWYRRGGAPVDERVIAQQCGTIVHRGPDDQGVLVDRDFGFGMRRLSILDVAGGHQPMTSEDGRYAIVYNGEIFNFPALKQELEAKGHVFRTTCDTEAILKGFVTWGEGVWPRLEGMFGAAIWDRVERRLTLARDPLGIKPMFYTLQHGGLAFGSELKALAPVPGLVFAPRPEAVDAFFGFGHVLAPHTIYEDVLKLPPGSTLTLGPDGPPHVARYWSFGYRPAPKASDAEWIERFRGTLLATVERHLLSDVPLGAFLSGGVDSSAIVAAMAQVTKAPVRTFTIGFGDPDVDESRHAARVARHLGCDHTERRVELEDAAAVLPALARCYDEPFADPSAVPTWYVSRLAREQVKVALSGDGGDELFAGYERHYAERLVERLGRWPAAIPGMNVAAALLPPLPGAGYTALRQRVRKVAHDSALPDTFQRFYSKYQLVPRPVRAALYHPDFARRFARDGELRRLAAATFPARVSRDPVENLLYADTVVRLPDDMLTKVDRASMAHSLEVRVPFLAHTFVDFAATIPVDLKLRGRTGKWLVRQAVAPWLPAGALDRPKQGFALPLGKWVRGDLGRYAESVWRDSGVGNAGWLDEKAVSALFQSHREGRAERSTMLFALAMFALWWSQRPRATSDVAS